MTGIIIQARTGSTRLPQKMLLPFYEEKPLIETILLRIRNELKTLPVIVATTLNPEDDKIVEICERTENSCFRGDENDVLQRFINCCEKYKLSSCIRICADNPFVDITLVEELLNFYQRNNSDYISFSVDNIPAMKTHFGFFSEFISLKALKIAAAKTTDTYYREHVTNYIYEKNPEGLIINFIPKDSLGQYNYLRLTIDTIEDFQNCSAIYSILNNQNQKVSINNTIKIISEKHQIIESMKTIINNNKK